MMKVYVEVLARFSPDGTMLPVSFIWEDGREYRIDRVRSAQRCASRKAGGCGILYVCTVGGQDTHLYYEDDDSGRWFLERKTG